MDEGTYSTKIPPVGQMESTPEQHPEATLLPPFRPYSPSSAPPADNGEIKLNKRQKKERKRQIDAHTRAQIKEVRQHLPRVSSCSPIIGGVYMRLNAFLLKSRRNLHFMYQSFMRVVKAA
jgi:hypothetical protein